MRDAFILNAIHERGPLTVAAFMDLALYDQVSGYYARAARRSGRAGDFFTSVDVGELFGTLVAAQIAEMADLLEDAGAPAPFDLVEAGAGNGRLSADVARAMRRLRPDLYGRLRLHLVEASAPARDEHEASLGDDRALLATSSPDLPPDLDGVLFANELLDAMPVHQVVMREDGLREVYVRAGRSGTLAVCEGPLSTPALSAYLDRLGVTLEPGWRVEINLRAVDWVREAARRLRRGFVILIDYGHEARELYSVTHAAGTLTSFSAHTSSGPESSSNPPPWLADPGARDITAHVDFTSVIAAAEAEGMATLGFLDQTYFLLALAARPGLIDAASLKQRLALKTLTMPGGLGSTMKVLILGKHVGTPALGGCALSMRVT